MFYAHSGNDAGQGHREHLAQHLAHVATRAKGYGKALDAERQAEVGGLLHDLGKYAEQFRRGWSDALRAHT